MSTRSNCPICPRANVISETPLKSVTFFGVTTVEPTTPLPSQHIPNNKNNVQNIQLILYRLSQFT